VGESVFILEVILVGAAAIIATNLDNLLLSISMAPATGIKRVAAAFLVTQLFVIVLSLGLSQGFEDLPVHWIGYLGILPIALGVRELLREKSIESVPVAAGVIPSALVLLSNSGDSLAVLVVTFSDGAEEFDPIVAVGAGLASVVLTISLLIFNRWRPLKKYLAPVARRLQPWFMICIGVLVLWDTPFDVQ
jgi:cadmium resistance protein CadD (predicted permease)